MEGQAGGRGRGSALTIAIGGEARRDVDGETR